MQLARGVLVLAKEAGVFAKVAAVWPKCTGKQK